VGGGDFKAVGEEFLEHFRDAGLRPGDDVLDMGCGVGRIAVPLTGFLDREGSYEGFDVEPRAIAWCAENVATLHPNFGFTYANLYNQHYNPEADTKACDYRFPYADDSFDFVLATSLCTHLLPADMQHYLAEARRVVRRGGTLFVTFFLLNRGRLERRSSWKPGFTFEYELDGCSVNSEKVPEAVVAYEEQAVSSAYEAVGLPLTEIIHGQWAGDARGRTTQDIVIAKLRSPRRPWSRFSRPPGAAAHS
jgi:SAM-dependent methyltransferase